MKPISGYNEVSVSDKIIADAYICKILNAKVENIGGNQKLKIAFDVAEGPFKDYYTNQFNNSQFEDKKYKGVVQVWLPNGDGSEKDQQALKRLKRMMQTLEAENDGFVWEWDESKLKGLTCGVILQNKEWAVNGKTGFAAVPYTLESVERIRKGKAYEPKTRYLTDDEKRKAGIEPAGVSEDFNPIASDEGDLPF